jgi:hypothetical protein
MLNYVVEAVGEMYPFVRWRPLPGRQSRPPLPRRTDRPRDKTAAAVRAHIVELALDAVRTERAFVRADARFQRSWRQILVAILAVRSKLQRHGRLVMSGATDHRKSAARRKCRISLDFGHLPQIYRCNSFNGSLELSFNRSSAIDERTCATLWCGISTLLTISDRLFKSRSTTRCSVLHDGDPWTPDQQCTATRCVRGRPQVLPSALPLTRQACNIRLRRIPYRRRRS